MKKIDYKKSLVAALSLTFVGMSGSVQSAGDGDFLGAMSYVAFNFAPRNYAKCDGQLLAISSNTALFSLLGTVYGGDGRTTFALPDMRGRVPIHQGQKPGFSNYMMGPGSGAEGATLNIGNLPSHKHDVTAASTSVLNAVATPGDSFPPTGNSIARSSTGSKNYSTVAPSAAINAGSVVTTTTVTEQPAGGSQPFSIMQPYTVLNCVIATQGIFPPRS